MAASVPATQRPDSSQAVAKLESLPSRIVFFDGVCAFCDGAMRWLIDRDAHARLHFAPLQGETAAAVRRAFPDRFPDDVDTVAYLHPGDGPGGREIAVRSAALFALCAELGGGLRLLAWLRWLPRPLADLAYRAFAANRYRLFGTLDACDVPSPGDRARLLP